MRWLLPGWYVIAALACGSIAAPAALADGPGLVVQRTDATQFPTVRVSVSVANSSGVPITGLDAQAFQLQEDGRPVEDLTVEPIVESQEPIAIALVIDTSGSMADDSKLENARTAATSFIDALGPADRATVVSFADQVTVAQDYSKDKPALKAAIAGLNPGGNTLLYDAVAQTAHRQAAQPERRKALILLTDGEDTKSAASLEAGIAAATSAASPAYAIGLGSDVNKDVLDRLASASGGQSMFVGDPRQLRATFLSISDQLRRQYVLRYLSKLVADTKPHGLAVQVTYSGQSTTGLGSFGIPTTQATPTPSVLSGSAAALPATVSVPTPAAAVTPTAVAASTPAAIAGTTNVLQSINPGLLAGVALLLLLICGAIVILLIGRRSVGSDRPASPAPALTPPIDMTEEVGGGTAVVDMTFVRPRGNTRAQKARLRITHHGQEREVLLDEAEATVGRDDSTRVPIKDPQASRKHARIFRKDDAFWVEDLESLNGTQVNGENVKCRKLATKDRIGIGETVLTFVIDTP